MDVLRQHGRFVRGLAQALVREPHLADDVAQETWLRWFTRPPGDPSEPRGWLGSVVRSVAANRQRGERRRADLESLVTPGEPASSPLDANLQAELVTRVVAAVMTLETPYRDVILSRYFRALTIAELVRESGTNEDTLRARERRALEQLRGKLDRDFGQRNAWAVGLATLAQRAPLVPAPSGAEVASVAHGTAWLAAGVLVVGGALGVALWRAHRAPAAQDARAEGGLLLANASATVSAAPVANSTTTTREPALVSADPGQAREPRADSDASSSSAVTSGQAELHGSFRFADGSPAAHVAWTVSGWGANEEREIQFGEPEDWSDPSGEADANGELLASFFPPQAYQFTLDVKAPGHAAASWRWGQIEAGQRLELGEITLPLGATITGRLVDGEGAAILGEEWELYADSIGLGQPEGRDETRVHTTLDPVTGAFELVDVYPGALALKAYSRMANWIDGPRVTAIAGQTLATDIVYRGPRNAGRLTITTFCPPLYVSADPAEGSVHVEFPDGSRHDAQKIANSSQSWSLDDLAPGQYVVTIDDPRFLPFRSQAVSPGSSVRANLEPCSVLALDVRDASGATVVPEQVTVEFQNVNFLPREIAVHDGSASFHGSVRLFPGDYVVRVKAGGSTGSVVVEDIGFDETRAVALVLGTQARLAGHLRRADGSALADEEVLLLAPAVEEDSDASPILGPNSWSSNESKYRKQLATTTTDSAGAFEFALERDGNYVLHAEVGTGLGVNSPVLTCAHGAGPGDVELVAPLGATVSGHLLGSANLAGLRLWLGLEANLTRPVNLSSQMRPVASDGSFLIEGLPAGTLSARLYLPDDGRWQFAWAELGTLELVDGQTLAHDFTLAELPAPWTLQATVDGSPIAGLKFSLRRTLDGTQQRIEGTLSPDGTSSPLLVFPGTWSVHLSDPGREWIARAPDVTIQSGASTTTTVTLQTATGTLRFLDATGQPRANQRVFVRLAGQNPGGESVMKTTDAAGRANFQLVTGDHLFSLGNTTGTLVTWTTTGPTMSDVQL